MTPSLKLTVLSEPLVICRLDPEETIPEWTHTASFLSVTRTRDELSIVCPTTCVPEGIRCAGNWRGLKVEGPLDFALTGILAGLSAALAEASISIFAVSTFDTDYILVREEKLDAAVETLRRAGYQV